VSRGVGPVLGAALLGLVALVIAGGPAAADASATPAATASATPAPSGAAASAGAPTPSTSGTPSPAGSASATPEPTPSDSAAALVPDPSPTPTLHPVEVGGVLFVSGVRTTYHPSRDPFGGTLHIELTVRNASAWTVDASAEMGARTLLGLDLGGDGSTDVRGLRPGEVRVLSKDIEGVGQWTVLKAHVTLTPPKQVGGTKLQPLARERWLLVPPWYLIALVVALCIVVWVLVRYRLRLVPGGARRRSSSARPAVAR
jgi:hypothetical protein